MRTLASFFFTLLFGQLFAQKAHPVTLKISPGDFLLQHVSAEMEWYAKGRISVCFKAAAIRPNFREQGWPAEGFFLKAGPKFYFKEENAVEAKGWALQGQAVFSYWRDWSPRGYAVLGKSWEYGLGMLGNLSYGWKPLPNLLIEPYFAMGVVPTFYDSVTSNDQPPFDQWKSTWYMLRKDEIRGPQSSHFRISGMIALSGGIHIGIQF
jgi:hypothetical protein